MASNPFLADFQETPNQSGGNPYLAGFDPNAKPVAPPPAPNGVLGRIVKDLPVGLAKSAVSLGETAVGLADIPTLGRAGKALESVGYRPKDTQAFLESQYTPETQQAGQAVQQAQGFFPTLGAIAQNPSVIPKTVVESSLPMLGGIGLASKIQRAGMVADGALAGGIGEGLITAGANTEQIRQETPGGLLTPTQTALGAGSGLLTGAITQGTGRIANEYGIGDFTQQLLPGGQIAKETTKGLTRRIGESAGLEAVQEGLQSAQETGATNLALNKPLTEGMGQAAALGAVTGAAMGAPAGFVRPPSLISQAASLGALGDKITNAHNAIINNDGNVNGQEETQAPIEKPAQADTEITGTSGIPAPGVFQPDNRAGGITGGNGATMPVQGMPPGSPIDPGAGIDNNAGGTLGQPAAQQPENGVSDTFGDSQPALGKEKRKTDRELFSPSSNKAIDLLRKHLKSAEDSGNKDEAALYKDLLNNVVDEQVTGFLRGADVREKNITDAIDYADRNGIEAHYIDADLKNLGGINEHFGNDSNSANAVYRSMIDIFTDEINKLGGQVSYNRHGGDEFNAVVLGVSQDAINTAKKAIKQRTLDKAKELGLEFVAKKETPNKKGTGIHLGSTQLFKGKDITESLKAAAGELTLSKEGLADVNEKQIEGNGAGTLKGQAGGIESGDTVINRQGPEVATGTPSQETQAIGSPNTGNQQAVPPAPDNNAPKEADAAPLQAGLADVPETNFGDSQAPNVTLDDALNNEAFINEKAAATKIKPYEYRSRIRKMKGVHKDIVNNYRNWLAKNPPVAPESTEIPRKTPDTAESWWQDAPLAHRREVLKAAKIDSALAYKNIDELPEIAKPLVLGLLNSELLKKRKRESLDNSAPPVQQDKKSLIEANKQAELDNAEARRKALIESTNEIAKNTNYDSHESWWGNASVKERTNALRDVGLKHLASNKFSDLGFVAKSAIDKYVRKAPESTNNPELLPPVVSNNATPSAQEGETLAEILNSNAGAKDGGELFQQPEIAGQQDIADVAKSAKKSASDFNSQNSEVDSIVNNIKENLNSKLPNGHVNLANFIKALDKDANVIKEYINAIHNVDDYDRIEHVTDKDIDNLRKYQWGFYTKDEIAKIVKPFDDLQNKYSTVLDKKSSDIYRNTKEKDEIQPDSVPENKPAYDWKKATGVTPDSKGRNIRPLYEINENTHDVLKEKNSAIKFLKDLPDSKYNALKNALSYRGDPEQYLNSEIGNARGNFDNLINNWKDAIEAELAKPAPEAKEEPTAEIPKKVIDDIPEENELEKQKIGEFYKRPNNIVLNEGNGVIINNLYKQWTNIKTEEDSKSFKKALENTNFGTYGTINFHDVLRNFNPVFPNEIIKESFLKETKKILSNKPTAETAKATDGAEGSKDEIIEHTTAKGKVIRGIIRADLTKAQAQGIDPYTFKKDAGWFIREKHLDELPIKQEASEKPQATEKTKEQVSGYYPLEQQRKAKAVERLRAVAKTALDRAETEKNRDRNTNTARRARMAAGSISNALHEEAIAKTALNVADAIESGEAKHLSGVTSKSQIELLNSIITQAVGKRDRQRYPSYAEYEKHKGRLPEQEDINFIDYPVATIHKDNFLSFREKLKSKRGGVSLAASIDGYVITPEQYAKVKEIMGDKEADSAMGWFPAEQIKRQKQLKAIGINNQRELESALAEFVKFKSGVAKEDPIKVAERALVGQKLGVDFFPTPKSLSARMAEMAGIKKGDSVLEPSAGNGNLADAAKASGAKVDVIEISDALRKVLEAKGHSLIERDFDNFTTDKKYDAVIMNPPFSDRMDAEHIMKAFSFVKPGGKLVAIAGEGVFFGSDKKAVAFREWLDDKAADVEKLPANTFKSSELLATTGVNARLVVISKPESDGFSTPEGEKYSKSTPTESIADFSDKVKNDLGLKAFSVFENSSGNIELSNIIVNKADQNKGKGTEALKKLVKYADEQGKTIVLSPGLPNDNHGTTSRARLVKFYKRFGFVESKGRNVDYAIGAGKMYREPSSKFSKSQPTKGSIVSEITSQLPAYAKKMLDDGRLVIEETGKAGIEGYYKGGKIHLVAENISPDSLSSVLAHEALHYSIATDPKTRKIFESFKDKMAIRFGLALKGIGSQSEVSAAQRVVSANTPREDRIEEFMSYAVSSYSSKPESLGSAIKKLISDLIASIRVTMLKMGIPLRELSAADLNYLALDGIKYNPNYSGIPNSSRAMASSKSIHEAVVLSDNEAKELGVFAKNPNLTLWNKSDIDAIKKEVALGWEYGNPWGYAKTANVKAIAKVFKNNGWTLNHKSIRDGKISSIYMERQLDNTKSPEVIRLSTHELPDTEERKSNRQSGISGKWAVDIIVNGKEPILDQIAKAELDYEGDYPLISPNADSTKYSIAPTRDDLPDWAQKLANDATLRVQDYFTTSKTFSGLNKSINTQAYKAWKSPEYKPVFDKSVQFEQDVARFANEQADLAPSLLPKLEGFVESIKEVKKGFERVKDAEKIGQAIFDTTINDKRFTYDELKAQGLTEQQITMYNEFFAAVNKSLDDLAQSEMARMARALKIPMAPENLSLMDAANYYADLAEEDPNSAKDFIDKAQTIEDLKKRGYAPLSRFGQYTVTVMEEGKKTPVYFGMYETESEANKEARLLREEYPEASITNGIMSQSDWQMFKGVTPETMEVFAKLMGIDQDKAFQEYLKLAVNNQSAMKRLIHRKKVKGYSIDPQRVLATFITSNARMTSKNLHMGDMLEAIGKIPKEKGDVKDEAVDLYNYVQNPAASGSGARNALFAWYLGGSFAAGAVNLTQSFTTTFPALNRLGSATDAAKNLAKAMKMAVNPKMITGDLAAALKRADEEGITAPQELFSLYNESMRTGFSSVFKPLRPLAKAWGSWFAVAESYNRRAAFIAAYNMAKGSKEAKFKAAEQLVLDTQFSYCVDTETECLTLDGWKKYNELTLSDILISVDKNGLAVESRLKDIHIFNGNHEAIKFSNGRKFSMVVTPEHDCLIQCYNSRDKKYQRLRKVKAKELKRCHMLIRSPLLAIERNTENYGNDFAALLGWVASEGYYAKFRNCISNRNVRISQSLDHNPEYVEEIENILIRLGGHYKKFSYPRSDNKDKNMVLFTLKKPLSDRVLEAMPDKELTYKMLSDMNKDEMESVMLAFAKGDGNLMDSGWIITQKKTQSLDVMQGMRILCAESATIYKSKHDWSQIYFNNGQRTQVDLLKQERINVDTVWCPETEHGTWVARRNGAVFVTGNSKSSRPNWARSTVGGTVFTFKTFTINYLEFLSKMLKAGQYKELSIALASLIILAGASGAPGADDLDDVIDTVGQWLGYNTSSKSWKEEHINKTILYGLSSVLPIDISSRLGVGNIIPGSAVLKRSETDKTRDVMEFIGPMGSMVSNVVEGFDAMASRGGITSKIGALTHAALPKGIADIAKAIDIAETGTYRDYTGKKVVDATLADAVAKGLGFQPSNVAEARRPERIFTQLKNLAVKTEAEIADLYAAGIFENDRGKVDEARSLLMDWNRKNPETPIRINSSQVLRRVKEMRKTSAERIMKTAPKELRGLAGSLL